MLFNFIEEDLQHSSEDIADFLKNYFDLPTEDYLEEFVIDSGLSLYDFTRIAMVAKDCLFYMKERKTDLTLEYLITFTAYALLVDDDEIDLDNFELKLVNDIREAYSHNKTLDENIKYYF